MGFAEVLTLIFMVLKLTHVIAWSWWWVMSPELLTVGFALLVLFGVVGTGVLSRKR